MIETKATKPGINNSDMTWDHIMRAFDLGLIYDLSRSIRRQIADSRHLDPFNHSLGIAMQWESVWANRYLEDAGLV